MAKAAERVPVNPSVLAWARKSAGLSEADAARKLSAKALPQKIIDLESGAEQPTLSQLRKLAQAYRRPTAMFFLPEPPKDFQPMHDFRRANAVAARYSPLLLREIRFAHERRNLALDLLADIDSKPAAFAGRAEPSEDPEEVGRRIREILRVSIAEQTNGHNRRNSFGFWRRRVERVGVLVFQTLDVPLSDMLGFSIATPTLPVIGINRKNRRGRVFTLLHEFTHLMLRQSGVCDIEEEQPRAPAEQKIEMFCNAVSSAALLPRAEFLADTLVAARTGSDWQRGELDAIADRYGVSAMVVLRKLLSLKRTTQSVYDKLSKEYAAIYSHLDKQAKESASDEEIRRNMPQEAVGRLGVPFIQLVLANYHEQKITLNDVSGLLGVKFRHVPKIEDAVRAA